MIAVGPNMFYTVTLPCTLWFLDRAVETLHATSLRRRRDTVLFIDARHIYRQMDRSHREFTDDQIDFIAGLVRVYRGESLNGYKFDPTGLNLTDSQITILKSAIQNLKFIDVPGLCKVATLKEIEAQGWSLNPGRYVGVAEREADDFDFAEKLEELNEELEVLNAEARELEERIGENVAALLE
jgi:type I restriction enzyme M protein